jgi:hypothetical protein
MHILKSYLPVSSAKTTVTLDTTYPKFRKKVYCNSDPLYNATPFPVNGQTSTTTDHICHIGQLFLIHAITSAVLCKTVHYNSYYIYGPAFDTNHGLERRRNRVQHGLRHIIG